MKISKRAQDVPASATIAVTSRAQELTAQGVDVVGFGAGAPDFDTPDYIKEAAIKSLKAGKTKYTAAAGIIELRTAIAEKLKTENGLEYSPQEVIVNIGGKHSVYEVMQAVLDPGDEVIMPTPYWVTYPEAIKLAGAVPKVVQTDKGAGYKITPAQLQEAITEKTAMLLINSPNNPGGFTYTPQELRALADVLEGTDVYVLSDEIYEKLIYGETEFVSFASLSEDTFGRTITLNGFSKAFSMTGWRLGYAGGAADLIDAMGNVQQQSSTHASSITQAAALAALTGPQEILEERRVLFQARRDLMVSALNAIEGISCFRPDGSFFAYPSCAGLMGRRSANGRSIESDQDFAAHVLETEGVAVVPGTAFGLSPHFRVSFAVSTELLEEGCARIARACAALG